MTRDDLVKKAEAAAEKFATHLRYISHVLPMDVAVIRDAIVRVAEEYAVKETARTRKEVDRLRCELGEHRQWVKDVSSAVHYNSTGIVETAEGNIVRALHAENAKLKADVAESARIRDFFHGQLKDANKAFSETATELNECKAERDQLRAKVDDLERMREIDDERIAETTKLASALRAEVERLRRDLHVDGLHRRNMDERENKLMDVMREVASELRDEVKRSSVFAMFQIHLADMAARLEDAANGTEAKTEPTRGFKMCTKCEGSANTNPQGLPVVKCDRCEHGSTEVDEHGDEVAQSQEAKTEPVANESTAPDPNGFWERQKEREARIAAYEHEQPQPQEPERCNATFSPPGYACVYACVLSSSAPHRLHEDASRQRWTDDVSGAKPHTPAETAKDEKCADCGEQACSTCGWVSIGDGTDDATSGDREGLPPLRCTSCASKYAWGKYQDACDERDAKAAKDEPKPYGMTVSEMESIFDAHIELNAKLTQERDAARAETKKWKQHYANVVAGFGNTENPDNNPTTHYTAMQEVKRLREVIVQLDHTHNRASDISERLSVEDDPKLESELERVCALRLILLDAAGVKDRCTEGEAS